MFRNAAITVLWFMMGWTIGGILVAFAGLPWLVTPVVATGLVVSITIAMSREAADSHVALGAPVRHVEQHHERSAA